MVKMSRILFFETVYKFNVIIVVVIIVIHNNIVEMICRRCWLGGRKGIRPVMSSEMLTWLPVWDEVQICTWPSHCHSQSLAPVNPHWFYIPVLPFWYWLTRVDPDNFQGGAVKR